MSHQPDLRASDAEREQAAAEIREHFAAGRLSGEELSERLDAAYRATTIAELAELRRDLPALPASPAMRRAEIAQRRAELQRRLLQQTGASLGVFVLCVAIWAATGGHHGHSTFWPIWVAIFPLVFLLRNGWRLYGPAPELDRVERELDRRSRHLDRRRHRRELPR